jgi:phage baseplate assembly protein gpV
METDLSPPTVGIPLQDYELHRSLVYGKYPGTVSDLDDPENRGRIRAKVPDVCGDEESPWAEPAVPFAGKGHGLVLLPEIGDGVWIEFRGGHKDRPIWSGGVWAKDQMPQSASPRRRVFATTAGHEIAIDEDKSEILIKHPGGAQISVTGGEITFQLGTSELKLTADAISLNQGMIKVTATGVSLGNDAMTIGA